MNREEVATRVAGLLTLDHDDRERLHDAIRVAYYEVPATLQDQLQAYSILGTYYAICKDTKRSLQGASKVPWMLVEDALEGWLKTLDRGIIATQHLNNLTGRHNF